MRNINYCTCYRYKWQNRCLRLRHRVSSLAIFRAVVLAQGRLMVPKLEFRPKYGRAIAATADRERKHLVLVDL